MRSSRWLFLGAVVVACGGGSGSGSGGAGGSTGGAAAPSSAICLPVAPMQLTACVSLFEQLSSPHPSCAQSSRRSSLPWHTTSSSQNSSVQPLTVEKERAPVKPICRHATLASSIPKPSSQTGLIAPSRSSAITTDTPAATASGGTGWPCVSYGCATLGAIEGAPCDQLTNCRKKIGDTSAIITIGRISWIAHSLRASHGL